MSRASVSDTTDASIPPEPRRLLPELVRPPGLILLATTGVAVLLTIDADSSRSMGALFLALPMWLLVGVIWVSRFLLMLGGRPWPTGRAWLRWLAIPALALLTFGFVRTDLPMRIRFELSRGAMDQLADDVAAGRVTDHAGLVGLYGVSGLEDWGSSTRVVVGGLGWETFGFERFDDPTTTRRDLRDRCRCHFIDLGGGWFSVVNDF
jgi:hypothetical protein